VAFFKQVVCQFRHYRVRSALRFSLSVVMHLRIMK
jgi:hypothetical protein